MSSRDKVECLMYAESVNGDGKLTNIPIRLYGIGSLLPEIVPAHWKDNSNVVLLISVRCEERLYYLRTHAKVTSNELYGVILELDKHSEGYEWTKRIAAEMMAYTVYDRKSGFDAPKQIVAG